MVTKTRTEWEDLPTLIEVFKLWEKHGGRFQDKHIDLVLHRLAEQIAIDLGRKRSPSPGGFLGSMAQEMKKRGALTRAQARGVLNTALANVRTRHRYFQSREYRQDLGEGLNDCLVCGAPLTEDLAVKRGVGPECYNGVLGL